jgi:hypothetical protein
VALALKRVCQAHKAGQPDHQPARVG